MHSNRIAAGCCSTNSGDRVLKGVRVAVFMRFILEEFNIDIFKNMVARAITHPYSSNDCANRDLKFSCGLQHAEIALFQSSYFDTLSMGARLAIGLATDTMRRTADKHIQKTFAGVGETSVVRELKVDLSGDDFP